MPIGDSKAQKYVIEELVRRSLGRNVFRHSAEPSMGPPAITSTGKRKLNDWWHQRKPYVRMVSNAVPHPEAAKLESEYIAATNAFSEEPSPENSKLRFKHILYGGVGLYNPDKQRVDLQHNFGAMYGGEFSEIGDFQAGGPFQSTAETTQAVDPFAKPMPGIDNINVSYKGDKGALKKAIISFKCYSLSDLERLEKLYMYPGIKVLLEWGWSKNTAANTGMFDHQPIPLVPLDDEILKNVGEVHRLLALNRRDSGGCSDGMMGTITNFSWSINEDLSFNCTTNITDIGDSIFTSNVNSPKINKKTKDAVAEGDTGFTLTQALNDIENQIEAAGRKDPNEVGKVNIKFSNTLDSMDVTFFRIERGTTSKLSSDSPKTSKRRRCYIKFGDVVDQLLNRLYMVTSTDLKADSEEKKATAHAMFSIGGALKDGKITVKPIKGLTDKDKVSELPISVISNHEYLISTDPDVCLLPGQIGGAPYDVEGELGKSRFNTYAPTGLDADESIKFAVTADQAKELCEFGPDVDGPDGFDESKKTAGLLANIFVNTDMLQDIAEASNTVSDFLHACTDKINTACGDIWAYNWGMTDEHPGVMTCYDRNFFWDGKVTAVEMPVSNLSGIVKNLSIKSAINSQTANALFIASNSSKTGKEAKKSRLLTKGLIPLDVDFTIDGLAGVQFGTSFSIDYIPARYRDLCYLFAFNVVHSVNATNWDTIVTCKFRFATAENGYQKVLLSKIPFQDGNNPEDIAKAITEDVPGAGKGGDIETQNEEVQGLMPQSIFQSLDAQGITIGAKTGDPGKGGIDDGDAAADIETRDDLATRLSETLATIYHKGTVNDVDNVTNAYAILDKILYMPEE